MGQFRTPRARWLAAAAVVVAAVWASTAAGGPKDHGNGDALQKIKHIVVVYEENHSFDNLYGGWEGVNGRSNADAARTNQIGQNGLLYNCLLQNDVNLTSPPLPADCTDTSTGTPFSSHFANAPFSIEASIPMDARTCPQPGVFAPNGLTPSPANLPGGCTRDIVHRFYQEQYQLHGGKQDLYVTGSDAVGLTMGYYDTKQLPIYAYLHGHDHPDYVIADDFFQGAFGGSFLNHQWLVAAATPTWAGMPATQHALVDSNGMPNNYPLYHATGPVSDPAGTITCASVPVTLPVVGAEGSVLLDAAGWARGAGGIREKSGVKLEFTNSTTTGNAVREQTQQLLIQDWRAIGAWQPSCSTVGRRTHAATSAA